MARSLYSRRHDRAQGVMAGLVPAIHVLLVSEHKDVDARERRQVYVVCARQTTVPGHDDVELVCRVHRPPATATAVSCSTIRAERIKARIISGSLTPGALSTPEETSTPPARVTQAASATFSAVRPPETMNGSLRSSFSSTRQSNTAPRPPGRVAPLGARASHRMRSATAA